MATTVKCQNCQASFPAVGGGLSGSVKCPFCGKMTALSGAGEAPQAPDEQGRGGGAKDEFDVNVTAKVERVAPPLPPQPSGILVSQADEFDTGQTLRSPVQGNIPPRSQDEFDTGQTMRQQEPVGRPGASAAPARPEAPAATPPLVGELPSGFLLDRRYRITKPLGSGGMGTVYKATDEETEKEYAIKTLRPELTASPTAIADLKKEVAIAQDLTHPNILRINYLGVAGATAYLVMEYIDGEDLEAFRLGKGGRITADEFRRLIPQLLAGLNYLHDKGKVHLDIKPQNVMVTRAAEVKLTDFGIAKSIRQQLNQREEGQVPVGSLCYMSPEQLRGEVCDRRSDIYSLGVMFYLLLLGEFPFSTKSREGVVSWHLGPEFDASGLSGEWRELFSRCLARDKAQRFTSCEEIIRAIGPESAGAPASPPLPNIAEDAVYHQYINRKRTGFLGAFDLDPQNSKAPIPVHPDSLVADCQRLLSSDQFTNKLLGFGSVARASQSRFTTSLLKLEKWAYFYPEYRGDFVNLWNQSAGELKQERIDASHFEKPGIKQKYPPPARSQGEAVLRVPPQSFPPPRSSPPAANLPSVAGEAVQKAKTVVAAAMEQFKDNLAPRAQAPALPVAPPVRSVDQQKEEIRRQVSDLLAELEMRASDRWQAAKSTWLWEKLRGVTPLSTIRHNLLRELARVAQITPDDTAWQATVRGWRERQTRCMQRINRAKTVYRVFTVVIPFTILLYGGYRVYSWFGHLGTWFSEQSAKQQQDALQEINDPKTWEGVPEEVQKQIKSYAAREYRDDHKMQAYTVRNGLEGYRTINDPKTWEGVSEDVQKQIRSQAALEYRDDYKMQAYVVRNGLEGYKTINDPKTWEGVPEDVQKQIRSQATLEHRDDYKMQAYAVSKDLQARKKLPAAGARGRAGNTAESAVGKTPRSTTTENKLPQVVRLTKSNFTILDWARDLPKTDPDRVAIHFSERDLPPGRTVAYMTHTSIPFTPVEGARESLAKVAAELGAHHAVVFTNSSDIADVLKLIEQPVELARFGVFLTASAPVIGVIMNTNGAVERFMINSEAEQAGLLPGDKVLRVNGVDFQDAEKRFRELLKYKPGDTVQLNYLRNGTEHTASVPLVAPSK